jgi:hypothetical protein
VWITIAACIMLEGCSFVGKDGVERSYGIYPIAAPEPQTVTIDKALTVAARVEVAGYGGIFMGFSSGLRARVPVVCLADGRCFIPKLKTNTQATSSFPGGTVVTDGVEIDGFTQIPTPAVP